METRKPTINMTIATEKVKASVLNEGIFMEFIVLLNDLIILGISMEDNMK